jgi:hypothetical protein
VKNAAMIASVFSGRRTAAPAGSGRLGGGHGTPDTPGSLRDLALSMTMPAHWLAWNEILASVRTGHIQVQAALGTDFFDYLQQHPSQAKLFSAVSPTRPRCGSPTSRK